MPRPSIECVMLITIYLPKSCFLPLCCNIAPILILDAGFKKQKSDDAVICASADALAEALNCAILFRSPLSVDLTCESVFTLPLNKLLEEDLAKLPNESSPFICGLALRNFLPLSESYSTSSKLRGITFMLKLRSDISTGYSRLNAVPAGGLPKYNVTPS